VKTVTLLYILNATLLVLHELESAYEKEWEILQLPGRITGFLLLHVPLLLLLFYGLLEVEKNSAVGMVFGVVFGIGGIIPFIVHRLVFRTADRFNSLISDFIIYLNMASGAGLLLLSARGLA
jgi:hypothetical protein